MYEYVLQWNDKEGNVKSSSETWKVGRLQSKVRKMTVERQMSIVDSLGKIVSNMKAPGTAAQAENIRRFCADLNPELKVLLWAGFTQNGVDDAETAKWWHPAIASDIVTGAFMVPVGEEGIGVNPNIPSVLAQKSSNA
jgi:hypothetical protein